jgi:Trypsin-like peptidase domain
MPIKKVLATLVLLTLLFVAPTNAADTRLQFVGRVYNAVVILYKQQEDGGMKMVCTATAYKKLDKDAGYRFVSASHCVDGETDEEQKISKYFITNDNQGSKTFVPVKLIEAGDRYIGDDFSIFEAKANPGTEVLPLGDSDKVVSGENVINVASPMGLGKQFFQGYVSNALLDRPPLDAGDTQWTSVMLVAIGGGPGSSGSAIVSEEQHAIIGFLVGSSGRGNIGFIVIPVNKFKTFEASVDSGKYKKSHHSMKEDIY